MAQTTRRRNHSDYLHDDVAKLKAVLFRTGQDLKGRAGEIWSDSVNNAKEKSFAAQENAVDYITGKPFKSMAIALLAGFIFGFLYRK